MEMQLHKAIKLSKFINSKCLEKILKVLEI